MNQPRLSTIDRSLLNLSLLTSSSRKLHLSCLSDDAVSFKVWSIEVARGVSVYGRVVRLVGDEPHELCADEWKMVLEAIEDVLIRSKLEIVREHLFAVLDLQDRCREVYNKLLSEEVQDG